MFKVKAYIVLVEKDRHVKIKKHCFIQIMWKISESQYTPYLIIHRFHNDIKGNQKENVQKNQKEKL